MKESGGGTITCRGLRGRKRESTADGEALEGQRREDTPKLLQSSLPGSGMTESGNTE
jgi:hypothetical protein